MAFPLTDGEAQKFQRDGFLIARQLLERPVMDRLAEIYLGDRQLAEEAYGKRDAAGKETRLAVRNALTDSPYAAVVRSRRVADTMATLLGDEVYHYHHKMMIKEPRVGGAWEWHQDYGYWYGNGCLYPDMGSCLLAISPADRANGCLQVIAGSHRIGRIDHLTVGDQFQADPARVAAARERLELVYCELESGDAIFFHANLLHRSDANESDRPRLSLISCYNTRHNDPIVRGGKHPNYEPLELWDDTRLFEALGVGIPG